MTNVAGDLPGTRRRKYGRVMVWVGAILIVLALVAGTLLGWQIYRTVQALDESEPVNGTLTMELAAGDDRTVYQSEGANQGECVVTGPDGTELDLTREATLRGSSGGATYVNTGTFTAETSGTHEITCDGPTALVGPAIDARWAVGSVFGIIAAIGALLVGGLILIVGVIIGIIGKREIRRALEGGYGAGSYGGGPSYPGGPRQ